MYDKKLCDSQVFRQAGYWVEFILAPGISSRHIPELSSNNNVICPTHVYPEQEFPSFNPLLLQKQMCGYI